MDEGGITKGAVHSWYLENKGTLNRGNVIQEICGKFMIDFNAEEKVNGYSLMNKLVNLNTAIVKRKRNKKTDLDAYLKSTFELPKYSARAHGGHHLLEENAELMKENKALKRKLEEKKDIEEQCKVKEDCIREMSDSVQKMIIERKVVEHDIGKLKDEIIRNNLELTQLEERLVSVLHYEKTNKLLNKKLRYRDKQLSETKEVAAQLKGALSRFSKFFIFLVFR